MKVKLILYSLLMTLWFSSTKAQDVIIKGRVSDANTSQLLPGATVLLLPSEEAVLSDSAGNFNIAVGNAHALVVRFVGYLSDTIYLPAKETLLQIRLRPAAQLSEVEVQARRMATEISTLNPRNIETLNEGELLKAACCNLSESFETNPSVDVSYTDAVTGAKEIQLLGLSGIYTQMLGEAIPTLRGLAIPFGLMYIPGSWMESIQISKGAGSVSHGYEGITGQINVEYRKPLKPQPRLHLNLYADAFGRGELNAIYSMPLKKHWNYMLMAHASGMEQSNDHNDDGFLDMPRYRQLNLYNRFHFNDGKRYEGQLGFKVLIENRQGGQTDFNPETDKFTTNAYGIGVETRRFEVYSKTGLLFPETPYKSLGLQVSASLHQQFSYFGLTDYDALQSSLYTNLIYMNVFSTTDNQYKAGVDFRLDQFNEEVNDSSFSRTERVPGAYFEYTRGCAESPFGAVLGFRLDYHNLFGWLYTPRMNLKYNFTEEMILRFSAGKGYRTPNAFADNIGLFVSAKQLTVLEAPDIEEAWNGGLNFTTCFRWFRREASLALDAYHTRFLNQWVVDQFSDDNRVLFYNLQGNSIANSMQATFTYEPIRRLDIKLAWRFDDVRTDYLAFPEFAKPLVARNKALINVAWRTNSESWRMDATLQWEGRKPLQTAAGSMDSGHEGHEGHEGHSAGDTESGPGKSPDFVQLMAQVTKVFKKWEVYLGAENLLNYTQHVVILSANNPFGNTFDATQVWGPVMGTRIYTGLRYNLEAKKGK